MTTNNPQKFIKNYLTNRKGTNCLKWDALDKRFGNPDLLAMWVADMEFKAPEAIIDALTDRVAQGAFGYSFIPDSYYESVIKWNKERHNTDLKSEWILHSFGVVSSLYWLVSIFTQPKDGVIILTPVYYPFFNAIKDNGRTLVRSELQADENGRYHIDFDDFEEKIVKNNVKMFILCNPHNPVSRLWSPEELDRLLAICKQHQVLVLSDEIHQDFVYKPRVFTSALSVNPEAYNDNLIVLNAASKTFNLASLLNSHVIIPNEDIRKEYQTKIKEYHQIEPNLLGTIATQAGYEGGAQWLDTLLDVIYDNYQYLATNLKTALPKLTITPLEATYLCWVDLGAYVSAKDLKTFVQNKCNLALDYGYWFSDKCTTFVRFNLGTDPELIKQAVDNIIDAIREEQGK